jgi:hypothetical protein
MAGIKEVSEVVKAVNKLSVDVIKGLKDGVQFDDIDIIIANIDSVKQAIEGVDQVGAELKDLDLNEIKELVNMAIELVMSVIAAIKAEEPKAEAIKEVSA